MVRSHYNFLIGHKFNGFAISAEQMNTYGKDVTKYLSATSLSLSYDLIYPVQLLGRWDYSYIANTNGGKTPNHFFLAGINTKWFDGHFQVALTYDQEYNPITKSAIASRFLISTEYF